MTAHNSKDNGLTGIGNAHHTDSLIALSFPVLFSTVTLPHSRLREACEVGVWYGIRGVGTQFQIKITAINGAMVRGRRLNHIPKRGTMSLADYGEVEYSIYKCNCAVCEGTNLSAVKQLENEKRWHNPNAL